MSRSLAVAALLFPVLVGSAFAQEPANPGVELKRLERSEGQWKVETETKQSYPSYPDGKYIGTQTCEWFAGHFHLVCRSQMTTPSGDSTQGQSIYGYDPQAKNYTLYFFNSTGSAGFVRGTVSGPAWTWNWEGTVDGKVMKVRNTATEESPTSTTVKSESSFDGGPWTVIYEGRLTKMN